MEPQGKRSSRKLCAQCLLLIAVMAVTSALPTAPEERTDVDGPLNEEPASIREKKSAKFREQQAEADRVMAENFLNHYGYYHKGKPLDILDVPEPESGDRQERDAQSDAIRMFQSYVGLPQTGLLDARTKQMMTKSRCGVEDVPESEDSQRPAAFNVMRGKWDKARLTWKLGTHTRKLDYYKQRDVLREAFATWSRVSPLYFEEKSSGDVDIDMLFGARDHGDSYPFDGASKVLAHAYGPIYSTSIKGDVHFDDDETWTTDDAPTGSDLLIVATHELGHSLGLDHSRDPNSLMYPYYGASNTVAQDDILGIQYLYGTRIVTPQTQRPPSTRAPPVTRGSVVNTPRPQTTPSPTRPTTTADPEGCHNHFDVVIQDVFTDRNVFTGVMDDQVFRFTMIGLLTGYPKPLHSVYRDAPFGADSIFTVQDTRSTYFIKDSRVWKYTNYVLDREFPRNLNPTHFPERVRFVLPYVNHQYRTERIFVFGSTKFWEYDFDDSSPGKPTHYLISQYWREVRSDVDYVVTGTDNNLYFISPRNHVAMTHMRRQTNRGQEKGHPKWLQNVCQEVAVFSDQIGQSGATGVHYSFMTMVLAASFSLMFFLRR